MTDTMQNVEPQEGVAEEDKARLEEDERRLLHRMAHAGLGICKGCGKEFKKEELAAKMAVWQRMGSRPRKGIRSRTVAYQCDTCREGDPDWNLPKNYN